MFIYNRSKKYALSIV